MENEMKIAPALLRWYEENRRELPWRETTDPYRIWISEIILQQTRVAQGLDYFNRFMDRFPDVRTLADAREDEVMKYWQGLGYYSRACNLHAAAKDVVSRFGGDFPTKYEEVLSLKGIGEYTAAAVCSFAWRQPYAVVDGNVYRVLSRLFGVDLPIDSGQGKKYFAELAQRLLDKSCPDLYNQAIMDFGAIQCLPKSPDCGACVFKGICLAYNSGRVGQLPVKEGKTVVKPRYFNYFHLHFEGKLLLSQRTAKDIWRNLYEFPMIETDRVFDFEELQRSDAFGEFFRGVENMVLLRTVEMPAHQLSHRVIYARFYELEITNLSVAMKKYLKIADQALADFAISRLTELYLETSR